MTTLALKIQVDANGNVTGFFNQATGEVGKFAGGVNRATDASEKLANRLMDMGHLAVAAFSVNSVYEYHKALLQTTAQLESMGKAYSAIFGAGKATQEMIWVTSVADQMGLKFADAAQQFKGFAAATANTALEGEHTRSIFMATSEAASTLGLSTEQSSRAFLAMSQMAGKGVVSMEELRGQLAEAIPGAVNLAANAMGVSVAELNKMVDSGTVLSSDLLPKLADELHKMYGASADGASNVTAELNRLDSATQALGAAYTSGWADDASVIIRDMTTFFTDPSVISGVKSIGEGVGDLMRTIADNKEAVLTVTGALLGLTRGGLAGAAVGAIGGFSFSQIINDTDVQRIKEIKRDLENLKPNATNWAIVDKQRAAMQSELAYLEEWANVSKSTYKAVYDTAAKAEADKTVTTLSEAQKRNKLANAEYDEWEKGIEELTKHDLSERQKQTQQAESAYKAQVKAAEEASKARIEAADKATEAEIKSIKSAQDVLNSYLETDFDKQLVEIGNIDQAWVKLYQNGLTGQKEFTDAIYAMDLKGFDTSKAINSIDELEKKYDSFYSKFSKINDPIIDSFGALMDATSEYFKNYEKLSAGIAMGDKNAIAVNERNQLAMYSNIAGAASTMFAKNSKEQKAMFEIQKTLTVMALALDVQKIASSTAVAAADAAGMTPKAGSAILSALSAPFPMNFVAGAAMAAIVGSIMSAFGGSASAGISTPSMPDMSGASGGAIGSLDPSKSIDKSTEYMNQVQVDQYKELTKIYAELKDMNSNLTSFATSLFVTGDMSTLNKPTASSSSSLGSQYASFASDNPLSQMAYNLPLVGGLLQGLDGIAIGAAQGVIDGITGSTKKSFGGSGLTIGNFALGGQSNISGYQDTTVAHDGGWFRNTTFSTERNMVSISDDAKNMLQRVFDNLRDGMISIGKSLDKNVTDQVNSFVISIGDIATFGKSGDEITKALNEAVSGQADKLAYAIFGDMVKAYGKMNEGYFETLNRLVTDKIVVTKTLGDVGLSINGDVIAISQSLVKLSGSLSNFVSNTNDFINAFYTDSQKATITTQNVSNIFDSIGMKAPESRSALVDLVKSLDLTTESGKKAYVTITSSTSLLEQYYKITGEETKATEERTAALKVQRDLEEEQAKKYQEAVKSYKDSEKSFEDARMALILMGKSAEASALSISRFYSNPDVNATRGFTYDDHTKYGVFNAGSFNYAYAKLQAEQDKKTSELLSSNALLVENVKQALQAVSVERHLGQYSPNVSSEYVGIRDSISNFAGDVGYVIRDAVDNAALVFAQESNRNKYQAGGVGIAGIMSAQSDLAFVSQQKGISGVGIQYGGDVIAYMEAVNNLDGALKNGRINLDQYTKATEKLADVFAGTLEYVNNYEAQTTRIAKAQEAYAKAGIDSATYYFDQLNNIVSGLTKAAKESNSAVSLAVKSIGQLNSAAAVFSASYNAATTNQEFSEKYKKLLDDTKLVSEYAQKASDLITTADAKAVSQVIAKSDAFTLLSNTSMRDMSMLLDGVKSMDAGSFQNAFYKLSDALHNGVLSAEQYKELFDLATKMYQGEDILAGIKASANALESLKEAALSLADQLMRGSETTYLSSADRFDELNRQYLAAVANGNAQELSSIVNDYLKSAKDASKSQIDYNRIAANVISDVRRVESSGTAIGLPSFDVGTNYIPQDMIAKVHKGEMIVPAKFNPATSGINNDNQGLIRELINEVRALRSENTQLQTRILNENRTQARTMEKWDAEGLSTVAAS
jgi:tape measure domain-containing protein